MSESSGSDDLVRLVKAGDEDAARKLYDAYVDRLVAVARRRLSQRLASRVDPEDIVQSVYRTFFGRVKEGKFHIDDQDDLCKLLMRITVHKTLRQVAYHQAAKRDKGQETGQGEHSNEMMMQLLDEEPTPQTAVAFVDQLEHFLNRLRPEERQILEMRLQGYSNEEIAKKLNIYDRKIRRVVERIRGLAEQDGLSPLGKGQVRDQESEADEDDEE
jgi:RNA polymerase sigma-70 factor (ECF subfamily)